MRQCSEKADLIAAKPLPAKRIFVKKRCRQAILIIFLVFVLNPISAQEIEDDYKTPDAGFALLRKHAEEHQYNKAKSIGQKILLEDPDYFDVALYMARIYGWEASYDSAYLILEDILLKEPDLFEAHETFVDLAYWENDWVKLETYAARALELNPDLKEYALSPKK